MRVCRESACVFWRVTVESLTIATAKFSVRPNLQLHGELPILHTTISTT